MITKETGRYENDYNPQRMLCTIRRKYPAVDASYNAIPKAERCRGYDRVYLAVFRHVMLTWYDMFNEYKHIDWKNMSCLLDEEA